MPSEHLGKHKANHALRGPTAAAMQELIACMLCPCQLRRLTCQCCAALQLNRSLGFSEVVYGLGSSIFFVGYSLFQVRLHDSQPAACFTLAIGHSAVSHWHGHIYQTFMISEAGSRTACCWGI